MNRFLVVIILVAVGADHSAAMIGAGVAVLHSPAVHSITCEHSTASLSCSTGYIYVYAANYGRTEFKVCPHLLRSNLNCVSRNALTDVQLACQGRKYCSVGAKNNVFGDPCHGTYKYLSVSYICQPLCSMPVFHRRVVCEGNQATLACGSKTIEILQANYGRTEFHPCTHPARSNLGCRSDRSMSVVKNLCSNRKICYISVTNGVFGDPCGGTYKYLDVVYRCY